MRYYDSTRPAGVETVTSMHVFRYKADAAVTRNVKNIGLKLTTAETKIPALCKKSVAAYCAMFIFE